MKDYHINIFQSDEDGGYIADIPDLPHCSAFGETPEKALEEVRRRLDHVETSEGVRILLAVESGSRAWGST